jgi:RNA polymerase sigma factor (sigma-70 family)
MATAHEWQLVRERIVRAPDARRSPDFRALYALAMDDGQRALRSFKKLDAARRVDLVHDLLATRMDAILDAESPRALFMTSLGRLAIQWLRRKDAEVLEPVTPTPDGTDRDPAHRLDLIRTLERLPPRDRQVLLAVAMGEDREEIARVLGTSRENVDQIVSRARKRLGEDR